jgi:hypothetical protein
MLNGNSGEHGETPGCLEKFQKGPADKGEEIHAVLNQRMAKNL